MTGAQSPAHTPTLLKAQPQEIFNKIQAGQKPLNLYVTVYLASSLRLQLASAKTPSGS